MKHWLGPFAMLLITAVAAHWATLHYAPSLIMDRTLSALKNRGVAEHAFTTPQRITPQTQAVVRSSPDLFYSLCRYDLSASGSTLTVTMGEWPGYQSLSFFDAKTNNFVTYRGTGEAVSVTLKSPGSSSDRVAIVSPTNRGVILIRRLAPTKELFDAANSAAEKDGCNYSG